MAEPYNPIVRMFGRYRAVLCESEKLPRYSVTVDARLDVLVARDRRRLVWQALRRAGLRAPSLEMSQVAFWSWSLGVVAILGGIWFWSGHWWPPLLASAPICYAAVRTSRPWAVEIPAFVRTVGKLTVYGTRFSAHSASGYRWSHGDISLKVRLLVAESLALPLDRVQPETSFAELID